MISFGTNIVTTVELGGQWCVVKIDEDAYMHYVSRLFDEKTAAIAAQKFAYENSLSYVYKGIKSHLPVMSVWKSSKGWAFVKLFFNSSNICVSNRIFAEKTQAVEIAKKVADQQKLEYIEFLEGIEIA